MIKPSGFTTIYYIFLVKLWSRMIYGGQSFQLFRNVYLEKPLNVLQILSGNDLFQQI